MQRVCLTVIGTPATFEKRTAPVDQGAVAVAKRITLLADANEERR